MIKPVDSNLKDCIFILIDGNLVGNIRDILLCGVYIPPEHSTFYNDLNSDNGVELFEGQLVEVISKLPDVDVIVTGDFNARTGCESDYIIDDDPKYVIDDNCDYDADSFCVRRASKDKIVNTFGRTLLSLCATFNLHIVNGRSGSDVNNGDFTCISNNGASVVDYVLVSTSLFNLISDFCIDLRTESDHFPLKFNLFTMSKTYETTKPHIGEIKYVWKNDQSERFVSFLHSEPVISRLNTIVRNVNFDVNDFIVVWQDIFDCAVSKCGLSRKILVNPKCRVQPEWFDSECKRLKLEKYRCLRQFRRDGQTRTLDRYNQLKGDFKNKCRDKKRKCMETYRNELSICIEDPKRFWHTLRRLTISKPHIPCIQPEAWYKYFSSLYKEQSDNVPFHMSEEYTHLFQSAVDDVIPAAVEDIDYDILNCPITDEEILASISSLKNGKSAGPDNILGEFFKSSPQVLLPYLKALFNRIMDTGIFPTEWAKAVIVPIHKKGATNVPDNYRGISLLSIFSKIFIGILNRRLTFWADAFTKIDEAQAGFRRGYSTVDNIFILQSIIQKYLTLNKGKFYCVFVDFSKAFDTVERQRLWYILLKGGVKGKMFRILHSMYCGVKSCVRTDKGKTEYFECPIGVRQGCMLSPFLFSFFINELVREV
ncbi:uncharacterized protein LOC144449832 [Glandiceps talaboti]